QRLHRHLAHERALARPDLHQAEALERAQRLADRRATDHELLGQITLGRELIAALEPPLRNHGLDLADDLFIDAGRLDGLDAHLAATAAAAARLWPRHLRSARARGGAACREHPTIRSG